ncbi:hypothetical protein A7U60_g713 [Sanghuangporus baumii]|uniref:Uncharacterized protein n=1 Tax=Sanghuangporus baumii TaxID=108892 RepID=A0A9Q5NC81_SANBA|nr:hypothetical protein A7U60_g713 [Sanghuangporus baumii]
MFGIRNFGATSVRTPGRFFKISRFPGIARFSATSRVESTDNIHGSNASADGHRERGSGDVDDTRALTNQGRPSQPQKPSDHKEAWGTLVRNDVREVIATFVVEGRLTIFRATMSRGLQPFTSQSAILQYDHKHDLAGEHCVDGTIGNSGFKLKFDNGPTITGAINPSTTLNMHDVDGWGAWKKL